MSEWHEIGVLIAGMVAKEPPFVQIVIGLSAAFAVLMILEGLRASFIPRRTSEPSAHLESTRPAFRGASRNAAKPPHNPKRSENIVKPHSAPRPTIRRNTAKEPEESLMPSLPQVASFED